MMQKKNHILTLFLCISSILFAQPRLDRPEISLGIHGGVKASTMLFNPSVKQLDILQSPLSPNGGLVFRYAEHKVCALQIECNYAQNGWTELYGTPGQNQVIYTRRLHYIQIPFLMHLGFGKRNFKAFFNLGPQIGYCIADKHTVSSPGTLQLDGHQHPKIDNPFDWGAAAGLGCYYRVNKVGVFQIEARFNFSLGGVFDVGQLEYYKMANPMGLSINLGYLWDFKVK
jgi:hypothetical protein